MANGNDIGLVCPVPDTSPPCIVMAHGGGGRMMQNLIERHFLPAFRNPFLEVRHDSAVLGVERRASAPRLAFTTDSYVVNPLFFPGGDIGTLAVNGTVNDLAMAGARPAWLSAGFILEEGLPLETLDRIVQSMRLSAEAAGVQIVTGDTKVLEHGKGDGVFINTAGIGIVSHDLALCPAAVREGDIVLLSGDIGRHGAAIMLQRDGMGMESAIESDCAPLAGAVLRLIEAGLPVHCLRDLTRGGLASALVEIATGAKLHIRIEEMDIQVREDVRGACELLGLDPLYIANEGRFVTFVPAEHADAALKLLREDPVSSDACVIGRVLVKPKGMVSLHTAIGANRIVDMISGEQLPRIC